MAMKTRAGGVALLLCAFLVGCATGPRDVQTPTGPVSGQIFGSFIILGVASRVTSTLNRPNSARDYEETVTIDVPAGTEMIVPALTGWDLGYGSTDPADLSNLTSPDANFAWRSADHHFGMARIGITVIDIDALAPGAATQSARIRLLATLTDDNSDDAWWGSISYQLIYLGRAPAVR